MSATIASPPRPSPPRPTPPVERRPIVTTRAEAAECACPDACERDHERD